MPRLITVTRSDLEITRRRNGRGFVYLDGAGHRLTAAGPLARIRALAIPPAWTDVRIAAHPLAHLQCCGTDDAGRIQYIYHPDWQLTRAARKQARLIRLIAALPRIRRRVTRDLGAAAGSKELALALGVALVDRTAMRVGRERYFNERGTRGAGTLFNRDIRLGGEDIFISFPAKGGKIAEYRLSSAPIAAAVRRIKALRGPRLLQYRDASGRIRKLKSRMINDYLRETSGAHISAKDFRMLHASAMAGEILAQQDPADSTTERHRQMTAVTQQVADFLRNTPMICRKSYICPMLFQLFETGQLRRQWGRGRGSGPRARERQLGLLLTGSDQATWATRGAD